MTASQEAKFEEEKYHFQALFFDKKLIISSVRFVMSGLVKRREMMADLPKV